ncbi:uridylate kinase, putative [Staphylothermus marinus F1]|uniref:Uridylate kinase n=1 Tax=Staphylothermus marinus (strain ATCC 43588 / DSM 3639 / JCM 9404 / F1) TaxID=399550 RepID=PYRH_STAMF|nr:UMP kinase [Staphylothermus marinus]A3DMM2.1 RecName: Full=Uridylate kinase; Short=UK; AltName: Full=Uridine monophosphate kinase; Short=UMP kinase; Short=UMPK [Staphylothermus marinus F1]ABN69882.1 uridylate kinase, putative [Staphylothermus marinus F1]
MSNTLVIKITGKLFDTNASLIKKYVEIFKDLSGKYKLAIITGGGGLARKYIGYAREIGVSSNYWLDMIGIRSAQLNAYLLISSLYPKAYPEPVNNLEELLRIMNNYEIAVLGGLIPGQSTSSVALEVAEALGVSKVIDYSAIDKVYDKDPLKYPDAKPYDKISIAKLREILRQKQLPGEYALIDLRALDIAERSKITIIITHYKKPNTIYDILRGENPGTIIYP